MVPPAVTPEEYYEEDEENLQSPPSLKTELEKLLYDSFPKDLVDRFFILKINSLKLSKLTPREITVLCRRIRGVFLDARIYYPELSKDRDYLLKVRQVMPAIKAILNRSEDGFERKTQITRINRKELAQSLGLQPKKSFWSRLVGR